MTFSETERARAGAWKTRTATLPDAAKQPAPYVGKDGRAGTARYDFCLPAEFADYTLLPEVRPSGADVLRRAGYPVACVGAQRPEQPPALLASPVRETPLHR